jgi:hypothetical protein
VQWGFRPLALVNSNRRAAGGQDEAEGVAHTQKHIHDLFATWRKSPDGSRREKKHVHRIVHPSHGHGQPLEFEPEVQLLF